MRGADAARGHTLLVGNLRVGLRAAASAQRNWPDMNNPCELNKLAEDGVVDRSEGLREVGSKKGGAARQDARWLETCEHGALRLTVVCHRCLHFPARVSLSLARVSALVTVAVGAASAACDLVCAA